MKTIIAILALSPWPIAGYVIKDQNITGANVTIICAVALFFTAAALSYFPEPTKRRRK